MAGIVRKQACDQRFAVLGKAGDHRLHRRQLFGDPGSAAQLRRGVVVWPAQADVLGKAVCAAGVQKLMLVRLQRKGQLRKAQYRAIFQQCLQRRFGVDRFGFSGVPGAVRKVSLDGELS